MRTFILCLIIVVGTVACLVQAVVAGYDRQFSLPGPVSTWQVQERGDGHEVVTVWGQSFSVDELSAPVGSACTYIERLPGFRELLAGVIRQPAKGADGGFGDQGSP